MGHSHDTVYIVLSLGVAILASWTALGLLERVRESVQFARIIWLLAAGLAMGGGIWTTHFIAMLGFNPGEAVTYEPWLTLLSFVLAVVATCGAFWAVSPADVARRNLVVSGTAMGVAIALMHYVGMAAIRTSAVLHHSPFHVVAAFITGGVASFLALFLVRNPLGRQQRAFAAVVLAAAIGAMHYIAMAGVTVVTTAPTVAHGPNDGSMTIAFITAAAAIVLLGAALATAHLDRRIRFLSVLDAGDIGYWEVRLPSCNIWLSPYADRMLKSAAGADFEATEKRLINIAVAMAKKSLRSPDPAARKEVEIHVGERWMSVRGRMVSRRRQHQMKIAGVLLDITDSHSVRTALEVSDARQKLLLNELNHRLKNNFASIQSIAALTARGSPDLPTFIETFQSRLMALSNTQTLLTNTGWESADIAAIFTQELHPYTERAVIEGPTILLDPKRALSMGLIAHELTTNAAKHGALKQAEGAIYVRWTQPGSDGRVRLEWRETGGPVTQIPKSRGFGSRLIKSSIEGALAGSAQVDYLPSGLRVTLNFTTRDIESPRNSHVRIRAQTMPKPV